MRTLNWFFILPRKSTRALLELPNVVSEEATSFGVSSLTTWKDSCTRISRIYGELSVPPFDVSVARFALVDDSPISNLHHPKIPQSELSLPTVPTSLNAMNCPTNPSIRPNHTVNDMIRAAIRDSPLGKLTLNDIVKAIKARFPPFQGACPRTETQVRVLLHAPKRCLTIHRQKHH